jgi:hypothetical protein
MATLSASSWGARARAVNAPIASPMPAGTAALPTADAATCRLTIRVVPPVPTRPAVVSVNNGKTGAAARPTTISPATASRPGPGASISAQPTPTPATAAPSTRFAPNRSAIAPKTIRPRNIIAQ